MTEEITTLSAFMTHMDAFKESMEEQYAQRIKSLEDRNAELAIFIGWGWTLAKECKYYHSRQNCGKAGRKGLCRGDVRFFWNQKERVTMLNRVLFETRFGDWLLALVERLGLAIVRLEDLG